MAAPAPPPMRARDWLGLAAVTALGLALRTIGLPHPPPGLWFDEGLNGLNALQVLGGEWPLYFNRHGLPEEPLHMWAMAAVMAAAGVTPLAIRLTAALVGALTVPVAFGCFREALRSNRWALVATLALATLRWHVHFSRVGLRTIWVPLAAAAALWLALVALRRPRPWIGAALGAVLAAAMHTYLAARLLPLILAALALWAAVHRRWGAPHTRAALAAGLVFGLGVAPLAVHLAAHPELLRGRVAEISLFAGGAPAPAEGDPAPVGQGRRVLGGLGENLLANLWAFNLWGDHVPKHNIPRLPVFDPVTGTLFLLGLWAGLRGWRHRVGAAALLLWLGGMLAASVLSFGAPNLLRTLGAAPAAAGLAVLGARRAHALVVRRRGRRVAALALGLWLLWFAAVETSRLFAAWAPREDVWADFSGREFAVADAIRHLPAEDPVAVFRGWLDHDAFVFLTRGRGLIALPDGPPPRLPPPEAAGRALHVFLLTDLPEQRALRDAILAEADPGQATVEVLREPSGRPYATHLVIERRAAGVRESEVPDQRASR